MITYRFSDGPSLSCASAPFVVAMMLDQPNVQLAYFTIRRVQDTPGRWQLGAIGHGPAGGQLAARIVEQIHAWDRDRTADPH